MAVELAGLAAVVPWEQLFRSVALAAASTVGKKLAEDTILRVLRESVNLQEAERQLLEDLHEDVRALVQGPGRAGDLQLKEAAQPRRSAAERERHIRLAQEKFMDACGILQDRGFERALVEYRVGLCWLLLGEREDAVRWFSAADQTAREHIDKTQKEVEAFARLAKEEAEKAAERAAEPLVKGAAPVGVSVGGPLGWVIGGVAIAAGFGTGYVVREFRMRRAAPAIREREEKAGREREQAEAFLRGLSLVLEHRPGALDGSANLMALPKLPGKGSGSRRRGGSLRPSGAQREASSTADGFGGEVGLAAGPGGGGAAGHDGGAGEGARVRRRRGGGREAGGAGDAGGASERRRR